MGVARWIGGVLTMIAVLAAGFAPLLAPHRPGDQFRDLLFAPPMGIHVVDESGAWRAPFVYPLALVDRLERRYREDRTRLTPLAWFANGRLVSSGAPDVPLLLLGTDGLGRDLFSRLAFGARASLGVGLLGALGALVLGVLIGAAAGFAGGALDEAAMRIADFVLVLPAIYVVLALRAVMPLVLSPSTVFLLVTALLAVVGWPYVARGVRAIVAAERRRDYAAAAVAAGASRTRVIVRHLLPATSGFLLVQGTLLLPAFILAEATLSFVGLGFNEPTPSWGTMLREAANVRAMAEFPWLLSPAAALCGVALGCNLLAQSAPRVPFLRRGPDPREIASRLRVQN